MNGHKTSATLKRIARNQEWLADYLERTETTVHEFVTDVLLPTAAKHGMRSWSGSEAQQQSSATGSIGRLLAGGGVTLWVLDVVEAVRSEDEAAQVDDEVDPVLRSLHRIEGHLADLVNAQRVLFGDKGQEPLSL